MATNNEFDKDLSNDRLEKMIEFWVSLDKISQARLFIAMTVACAKLEKIEVEDILTSFQEMFDKEANQ
jgi:hypothetical protein